MASRRAAHTLGLLNRWEIKVLKFGAKKRENSSPVVNIKRIKLSVKYISLLVKKSISSFALALQASLLSNNYTFSVSNMDERWKGINDFLALRMTGEKKSTA